MIRQLVVAASAALLTYVVQPAAIAQVPDRVDWTISPAGENDADRVQFSIGYRRARGSSNWSNTTDLAELAGLTAAQLAGENTPVRFQIVREAGRFDCDGVARRGRGTGECSFTPDPAFTAALARHRIAAPDREQSYGLALARVGIAMVDELERQGYQTPAVDDLVGAGIHRVDADYIRGMAAAGYRVGTVDGLVQCASTASRRIISPRSPRPATGRAPRWRSACASMARRPNISALSARPERPASTPTISSRYASTASDRNSSASCAASAMSG